jgi:hypothetical protein
MFAHFDYSSKVTTKKFAKNTTNWYKEAAKSAKSLQLHLDVPFVTTGRCRSADLAVAGVVAEHARTLQANPN